MFCQFQLKHILKFRNFEMSCLRYLEAQSCRLVEIWNQRDCSSQYRARSNKNPICAAAVVTITTMDEANQVYEADEVVVGKDVEAAMETMSRNVAA
jgi:hypothetical protein